MQKIAERLGKTGLSVVPNFLLPLQLKCLQEDLPRGEFHRAGVGQGKELQTSQIRRDEIRWLSREDQTEAQTDLWGKLDELQQAFNRTLFLGLKTFEGHYANYAEGGFYQRHRDSFRADDSRMVTLVLYLNEAWQPAHGGRLRIYDQESHQDIDPVGGTLVCFLSRESEHEVLTSHHPRQSFTGWFKT